MLWVHPSIVFLPLSPALFCCFFSCSYYRRLRRKILKGWKKAATFVAAGEWDPNPQCFPSAQSRVLARWDPELPAACATLSLPASGLERDSSLGQWGSPLRSTGLEAGCEAWSEQDAQDLGGMNGGQGGSNLGLHRLMYLKSYQTCDNRFLLYLNFLWEYIVWEIVFLIIYIFKNPTNSFTFKEINDSLWALSNGLSFPLLRTKWMT